MSRFKKVVHSCKGSSVKGRFNAFDKQNRASESMLALASHTRSVNNGLEYKSLAEQLQSITHTTHTVEIQECERFVSGSVNWTPTKAIRF